MAETNADALRLAEAARLLAERDYGEGHTPPALLLEAALVYSNLAIAEGQERVAEALEGQVEGRYRQALVEAGEVLNRFLCFADDENWNAEVATAVFSSLDSIRRGLDAHKLVDAVEEVGR